MPKSILVMVMVSLMVRFRFMGIILSALNDRILPHLRRRFKRSRVSLKEKNLEIYFFIIDFSSGLVYTEAKHPKEETKA